MAVDDLVDVILTRDFNVPLRLEYVNAVEFSDKAQVIQWYLQKGADLGDNLLTCTGIMR